MGSIVPIKHFTDLEVWQKAHHLFLDLCNDVNQFPPKRSAAVIADQILRSSGSISANIAEGFNRSKAKFLNSLDIALGETNETENWMYKLRDLGLVPMTPANQNLDHCREIGRMLNGLIRKIESRPS